MEFWARWAHRALWHASLWHMHESHHRPRDGPFELNDVFAIVNAVPAMSLLAYGFFNRGLVPGLCFGAVSLSPFPVVSLPSADDSFPAVAFSPRPPTRLPPAPPPGVGQEKTLEFDPAGCRRVERGVVVHIILAPASPAHPHIGVHVHGRRPPSGGL